MISYHTLVFRRVYVVIARWNGHGLTEVIKLKVKVAIFFYYRRVGGVLNSLC